MYSTDLTLRLQNKSSGARLHFLDFLRGAAALIVLFGHSVNIQSAGDFLRHYFDTGRLGVTTFFLVSGFVIPLTLERSRSVRAFVVNRIFRLYPLYWLSIIGVAVWITINVPLDRAYYSVFAMHLSRNLLVNATMLQELFRVPDAIPVYWTLAMELAFYGCCVCLYRLGRLARSLETAWYVLGLVFAVTVVMPFLTRHRVPFEHIYAFAAFFFGTAVYRHYQGVVSRSQLRRLTLGALSVAVAGVACNYYLFTDSTENIGPVGALVGYLTAFGLFLTAYAKRSWKYPVVLRWLGMISYSVYLLHPLVIELSVGVFGEAARMLVGIPATLVLSTITYLCLEAPAVRMGQRLAKRFKNGEPQAAIVRGRMAIDVR